MTEPIHPGEAFRGSPATEPEAGTSEVRGGPETEVRATEDAPTVAHVASTEPAVGPWPRPPLDPESSELIEALAPPRGPGEVGWLGPYRVLEVLGSGGMGVVFRAEDPQLRRSIALKTMRPALAAIASNRLRFIREAQAVAALDHDHIIPIYHVGEDRGIPFIAMPLLKGETLDDRLRREGRPPIAEALRIGREVAEGLAAAHAGGLVHRDIKPANIWLEAPRGRVRILDFGLARAESDLQNLTTTGAILGTPAFMSPEQAQGRPIDPRSDLFSLGCVLYRCATGSPPFQGTSAAAVLGAVLTGHPPPPRTVEPAVPWPFSALILRLLAKDPDRRPSSALEVAGAIAEIERASPPPVPQGDANGRSTVTIPPVGPVGTPPKLSGAAGVDRRARRSPGRKVLLGCGFAAFCLLSMLGGGAYYVATQAVPWLKGGFEDLMERERGWDEVARFWRPPPDDAGPDQIFPPEVGGFRRSGSIGDAEIPELNIRRIPGQHASYFDGSRFVELVMIRATALEKEALFKRATEAINPPEKQGSGSSTGESGPSYRSISGSAEAPRMSYRMGLPDRRGILWWDKGWLFVARIEGAGDPEAFLKQYLAAITARPGRP
jgi:Protein kinase domain